MQRAPRAALLGLAVCLAVIGRGYWLARADEHFAPTFWPFAFLATAILCILLAAVPSRALAEFVGAAVFVACCSRVAAVVVNLAAGDVYSNADRATVGLALWPLVATTTLYAFTVGIAPWASAEGHARRRRRRA